MCEGPSSLLFWEWWSVWTNSGRWKPWNWKWLSNKAEQCVKALRYFFPVWWSVWTNTGRWISEWFTFAIVSRKLTINPSTHSQWFFWFPSKHIYWPFLSFRLFWISMPTQHLLMDVLRHKLVAFNTLLNDVLIKRHSNEWIVEQFSRTLQNWWHLVFLHGFHNLWWLPKFFNIFHFCATELEPFRLLIFCQTF